MSAAPAELRGGGRLLAWSLAAAAIGLAGSAVAVLVDRRQALFAWLIAFSYALAIALGALVFLMICHAMGARWPVLVRRLAETVAGTLPVFAVLFLPLLLGLDLLYPWVRPELVHDEHARHLLEQKRAYLNVPFFLARAIGYLSLWGALGWLLRRWSVARDRAPSPALGDRFRAVSAVCLPAVALTWTFASFDWLMSLTPEWVSTMFPVYWFAGGFLGALALLIVMTRAAERAGHLAGVRPSHYHALGRLLFAFTVFWAYVAYFQVMLIWIADRPHEVTYYAERARGPWAAISAALVAGRFVLPFAALLPYRSKRSGRILPLIAGWVLALHYLDAHWLVAPSAGRGGAPFHWADAAALLAVAGSLVAFATWQLRGRSLVPRNDPALADALRYDSA